MPETPDTQTVVNVIEGKVVDSSKGCGAAVMKWCSSTWKAILAEFVATALLILVGCMSAVPIDNLPTQPPMYTPVAFGFVVMFNIQIFGHLSGAHMNPAVSLAAVLYGTMSVATAVAYAVSQCVGAILGYGILTYVSPVDVAATGVCVTQIHARLGKWQALVIEIALTSALNFINCSVWDPVNKKKTDSVPIKFGLAIVGLSLAGGPLTGASLNPARSLGPALFTGIWTDFWIYCIGPLIAGILPVVMYRYVWLKAEEPEVKALISDGEHK